MEIRVATDKDLDTLWEFEKKHRKFDMNNIGESFDSFYHYGFEEKDKQAYFSEIQEHLSNENSLILIAQEDTQAVGFIIGEIKTLFSSPKGHIAELFVQDTFRSKGYGELLVKELLVWFKENKLEYVNLGVLHHNSRAIKFYEKMGFKPFHVKMTLRL